VATATILLLPSIAMVVAWTGSMTGGAAPPPFGAGDWTVTGSETARDGALILDGNLSIENGASLTLVNFSLQILCREGSSHWIRVKSGGTFNVLSGSVVGSFDSSYRAWARHGFTIDAGAAVVLRDSTFLAAGVLEFWDADSLRGGVLAYSDMTVRNCTFAGSRTAITVFSSDVEFEDCTFRQNDWAGAVAWGSNVDFVNCSFEQNYIGAIPYRSVCGFTNCTFTDNFDGAVPDSSTCGFSGCLFIRNAVSGLYCNPQMGINTPPYESTIYMDDCVFDHNRVGVSAYWSWADAGGNIFPLWHNMYMTNCEFRDNPNGGMLWPRSEPDLDRVQSPCTWNVTSRARVVNNTVNFNGGIGIENGGEMTITRSEFSLDPGQPGWNAIEVKTGGALRIRDNSTFKSARANFNYLLACRPDSVLELNCSGLRDCGRQGAEISAAGPHMQTSRLELVRSAIWACPFALYLNSSKGARIESAKLAGTAGSLYMSGSSATVSNSSIGCATLDRGSLLWSINSSLDIARLDILDGMSAAVQGWHLDIQAIWEDGRTAAGAAVVVRDRDGVEAFNGSCGPDGALAELALWEATYTANGTAVHTPHAIECSLGPVQNATSVDMTRSRSIAVTLRDSTAPVISVIGPAAGSHLASGTVLAFGTAQDDMALARVELSVDSGQWTTVFSPATGDSAPAGWNLTLELEDGFHTLEARATDASGNPNSTLVSFFVDTVAPNVFITSPVPGYLTNLSELAVGGLSETGASVTVNGIVARTSGSSFSAVIRLSEGQNEIVAVAVDAAGNSNQSSITVTLDTVPPKMSVRYDPPDMYTNRPQLNISGEMQNGSSVTVNGRWVVLPGLASSFATILLLRPGPNPVTVVVTDRAGNYNMSRVTVVYDTTPPAVEFVHPPDGFLTRDASLTLMLLVEGGALLAINGRPYQAEPSNGTPGGKVPFNLAVALTEGANTISVRAQDAAGNVLSLSRRVVLDTVAPSLAISSPPDGFNTSNDSVFVVGVAEPGSTVIVQGAQVQVGISGDFGAEVRLGAGGNRIAVQAQDAAGNQNELSLNVTRTAGKYGESVVIDSGPDRLFWGFVAVAAVAMAAEGALVMRIIDRRRAGAGRSG
jgi:hypothetical protein